MARSQSEGNHKYIVHYLMHRGFLYAYNYTMPGTCSHKESRSILAEKRGVFISMHDSPHNVPSRKQGFHDGQAWAHWEYSPEEWALFDRVDWQAVRLRYWLPNLALLVCVLILGVVFFPQDISIVFLILGLTIVGVVFLIRAYAYHEAKIRHQARQNRTQPQKVTLSGQAVWEAGTYFPFLALQSVRMTSQPAVLHFRRRRRVFSNDGNGTNNYDTLRVLVPHGHEEEAMRLVERFRARIIELNKPGTYTPPEPV